MKRNCQLCTFYKDEYCENLGLKPCYPQEGCDFFSKRNELKKDTMKVLEAYISPNSNGSPEVKDAIKDLLEWSKNEYEQGLNDALFNSEKREVINMSKEEQTSAWMYTIFNKDLIMEKTKQLTKEAKEAGMTLTEYLESINPLKEAECLPKDKERKMPREEVIERLKQESCEDAISRQAVLDGLASIAKAKAKSDAQKSLMGRVMFFTERLPSVNPQDCDTCEVGNPCLYCKHEFEPQESEVSDGHTI